MAEYTQAKKESPESRLIQGVPYLFQRFTFSEPQAIFSAA